MADRWFAALGWGLTGVELDDAELTQQVSAGALVDWLAGQGWDASKVQRHRRDCQEAQIPWPHPVPQGWLGSGTAARYQALLTQVRASLGVDGLTPTPVPTQRRLGEAERRLLAELPPHHGNVG